MSIRKVQLGDVCSFVGGGTPSRKQPDHFDGNIPWATVKDFKTFRLIDTEEHITKEAIAGSATNLVEPGTVLLVSRVGLGKVAIAERQLAINQDIKGLIPNKDVLSEYLFWFLLSRAPYIERMGTGATVKGITLQDIRGLQMPLPPLNEQRIIIDLLSRAERIVHLRREAQKKAAEIIPALFLDMFGDPATNPKGWPESFLGEHVAIPSVVRTPDMDHDADHLCMGADSIESKTGKMLYCPTVREVAPRSGKYWFESGDVLYSKIRPYLAKVALATRSGYCSADMYPLRCKETIISRFLLSLLLSKAFTDFATAESVRAQMPKLNRETLFSYQFPLPPLTQQKRFTMLAEQSNSILDQQSLALQMAETAFDALLMRMFGGCYG